MSESCPFCDREFPDSRSLVEHVVDELAGHHGAPIRGLGELVVVAHHFRQRSVPNKWTLICWCKRWQTYDVPKVAKEHFAQHLEDHGGLHAHILELTLGVEDA